MSLDARDQPKIPEAVNRTARISTRGLARTVICLVLKIMEACIWTIKIHFFMKLRLPD